MPMELEGEGPLQSHFARATQVSCPLLQSLTLSCRVAELYGRSLNVFSWSERRLLQTIDLGPQGIAPLEVRFLHDPRQPQGFVGCALNANVFR
jgi:hypothetical protein